MNQYTIYCSEEQTRKALKLGAPIRLWENIPPITPSTGYYLEDGTMFALPTAEQMISWLEQNTLFNCIQVSVDAKSTNWMYAIYYGKDDCIALDRFSSRQEATLAAIYAALDYLEKKGGDE